MSKGFTLIEVLVYSAIIALFLGGTVMIAYNLLETSSGTQSRLEVESQKQFLRQKLDWIIRGASTVISPALGTSGSVLSVNKTGSSENPFTVDLSNGIVRLQTSSGVITPITDERVSVSNLKFENFSLSSTTKNTLRVSATILSSNAQFPASSSMDFFISIQ